MKTPTQTTERSAALPERFTTLNTLGQGGLSVVSLVRDERDRSLWACKTPLPGNTDFARAAEREISITGPLSYPGVARARALKPGDPSQGLLLPYFPGKSLETLTKVTNPSALANIISALAITLYYLKLRGVAHGDLKPHNVIAPVGFDGESFGTAELYYLRLIDFSMAQLASEEPADRLGVGTLGYAAPETLKTGSATHKSDLFSLGVLAHTLATGTHPFISADAEPAAITAAVREATPPTLASLAPEFPEAFSEIVESLMAKEPALRPPDGFTVCERLAECGASYPYQRALRPKHILPAGSFGDVRTIAVMPGFDLPARGHLRSISEDDQRKLRLILEHNFRTGVLRWSAGQIVGGKNFESYSWPLRLRREALRLFSQATLTEARWLINSAVAGGIDYLTQIDRTPGSLRPAVVSLSLVEALKDELSPSTIRRQSAALARRLERSPRRVMALELLATLYCQAEDIEQCADVTFEFCRQLAAESREVEALQALGRAQELADTVSDTKRLGELLHRDGDIRKDIGDIRGAEQRYLRVIECIGDEQSRTVAETYKDLGDIYKLKQEFTQGIAALGKARALYERFDDLAELARVTNNIGNIHWINADFPQALTAYRTALRLHRKRGNLADISSTVNNIASIYAVTGRIDRGVRIYKLCLDLKRQVGDKGEIARTLNNLGYTYYLRGEVERALEALSEALAINRGLGSKKEILFNLDNISSCALTAGKFGDALAYLKEGRELADELHDHPTKATLDLSLAKIFTRTGRWRHADRLCKRSLEVAQTQSDKTLVIRALLQLAELRRRQRCEEVAGDLSARALRIAEEINDPHGRIQALLLCGERRLESIRTALKLARDINSPREIALANLTLAEELIAAGDLTEAGLALTEAGDYFEGVSGDIDRPRFVRVWAELQLQRNGSPAAMLSERLVATIDELAIDGEKSESWQLGIWLSQVSLETGMYEQGYSALSRSMKAVKELVSELPDKTSEKRFLAQPQFSLMAGQIQTLREKLNIE